MSCAPCFGQVGNRLYLLCRYNLCMPLVLYHVSMSSTAVLLLELMITSMC